jgi:hypothetical protein
MRLIDEKPEYILTYHPRSISLGTKIPEKGKELVTAIASDLQISVLQASLRSILRWSTP